MKRLFIICVSLCMLGACAGVTVTKITDATYEEGVRFYRSWPYLWVKGEATTQAGTTTNKDTSEIIWLPKYDEEYVVRSKGIIGSSEYNVALLNGWQLSTMGMKRDTQIPQTIGAITGLLTGVAGVVAKDKKEYKKIGRPPGLYPFQIDKISGLIIGVDWDHPVFIEATEKK